MQGMPCSATVAEREYDGGGQIPPAVEDLAMQQLADKVEEVFRNFDSFKEEDSYNEFDFRSETHTIAREAIGLHSLLFTLNTMLAVGPVSPDAQQVFFGQIRKYLPALSATDRVAMYMRAVVQGAVEGRYGRDCIERAYDQQGAA